MRVLVTGSRDWTERRLIREMLNRMPDDATLVHGGCLSGADAIADDHWTRPGFGGIVEVHRAEWTVYGSYAGPKRNLEMVESGFDVCLAFIKNDSKGASGCLEMAKKYRKFHPESVIRAFYLWA